MSSNKQVIPLQDNVSTQPQQLPPLSVTLATVVSLENGYPVIDWPENPRQKPTKALSQVKIDAQHINHSCTLAFINGDQTQPIVMGMLQTPEESKGLNGFDQEEPIIIRSEDSITLQAGRAKIQLHADGRINLQGIHINSQAYGPNKIKGTSIKIN